VLHVLSAQRHCSVLTQKSPPPDALGPEPPTGGGGAGIVAAGGGIIGVGTDGIDGAGVMCGVGAGGGILVCAIAFDANVPKANRIRDHRIDM
jgi:hypothetical protein